MKLLPIIVLGLLSLASFVQREQAYIVWHPDRRLSWSDFRGSNPTPKDGVDAISHCVLYPSYSFDKHGVRWVVESRFVPSKSWVRNKAGASARLLQHEQGHFDLTEYYARLYRKALTRSALTPENVSQRMQFLTDSIMTLCDAHHELYDAETQLGRNVEAQNRWDSLIQTNLQGMQDYAYIPAAPR